MRYPRDLKVKQSIYQQHKKFFIFAMLIGLYPPGMERLVKWKALRVLLFSFAFFGNLVSSVIYVGAFFIHAATHRYPLAMFFALLRRQISTVHNTFKYGSHLLTSRGSRFTALFDTWDTDINRSEYLPMRQALLRKNMSRTYYYCIYTYIVGWGILQIPGIFLLLDRYGKGAATVCFPHNPAEWYHPHLLLVQNLAFVFGIGSIMAYHTFIHFILTMALTQMQVLKQHLSDIFENSKVGSVNKVSSKSGMEDRLSYEIEADKTRKELGQWLVAHKTTTRWLNDISNFLTFTSSVKFVYLCGYLSLCVFTIPMYLKKKNYVDIAYVAMYFAGMVPSIFYETRLIDEITDTSSSMVLDAYAQDWMVQPRDITKSLHIIASFCAARPFSVVTFKMFPDDSTSLLKIMQTAYNALSFLLQMELSDE